MEDYREYLQGLVDDAKETAGRAKNGVPVHTQTSVYAYDDPETGSLMAQAARGLGWQYGEGKDPTGRLCNWYRVDAYRASVIIHIS